MKEPRLQPATRDKTCQICGTVYTYPEVGSPATRFHCELCAPLPASLRKVLGRMAKRLSQLERQSQKSKSPNKHEQNT